MATLRQKKLAKAAAENAIADKPLNKQELVVSVGYTPASADKKATEILESKGVQEELTKLGFNEDTAKGVVAEILVAGEDDGHRLKAADMVFKTFGTYAPEKRITLNLDGELTEREQTVARELLQAQRN